MIIKKRRLMKVVGFERTFYERYIPIHVNLCVTYTYLLRIQWHEIEYNTKTHSFTE